MRIVGKSGKPGTDVATLISPNFILSDLTLRRLQRPSDMCKEMLKGTKLATELHLERRKETGQFVPRQKAFILFALGLESLPNKTREVQRNE